MATVVTLAAGSETFTLEQPQWRVRDYSDVFQTAPSRGRDLPVAGADGLLGRDRRRDALAVTLQVQVNGRWDDDGTRSADPAGTARELLRDLEGFLTVSPRRFTMTVDDGSVVLSADVIFEEQGRVTFRTPSVVDTTLLFVVPAGRFEESSGRSGWNCWTGTAATSAGWTAGCRAPQAGSTRVAVSGRGW
jgi:hypothetical protein